MSALRLKPGCVEEAVNERNTHELLAEIVREESRLTALEGDVETARARLAALRAHLTTADPAVTVTNAAKVALFRTVFRGREDVFPRRWENDKKGKSGYSPACDNEWEHGLCEK